MGISRFVERRNTFFWTQKKRGWRSKPFCERLYGILLVFSLDFLAYKNDMAVSGVTGYRGSVTEIRQKRLAGLVHRCGSPCLSLSYTAQKHTIGDSSFHQMSSVTAAAVAAAVVVDAAAMLLLSMLLLLLFPMTAFLGRTFVDKTSSLFLFPSPPISRKHVRTCDRSA